MAEATVPADEPIGNEKRKREQHRMGGTPVYLVWAGMIRRCHNPNSEDYERYGGRGIAVCERWRNSFLAFKEDMGERPDGMQIDRIDNSRGYEPGNCRWVTCQTNNRNRRDSIYFEFRGERRHINEIAEMTGIWKGTIMWRVKRGMSIEEAATKTPDDQKSYFEVSGERLSLGELAERTGLDRETIMRRIRSKGMSIEDAIAMPLQRKPVLLTYNGQQMRLFELAKLTGVNALTIRRRMTKEGMTAEQAVAARPPRS